MAAVEPLDIPLCRTRGDTFPDTWRLGTAAVPVNITGFTFEMTVDTLAEPGDALTNVYTLTGVITDAPNGLFQFAPSGAQADALNPNLEYFYDVQMIDGASAKRTILKSTLTVTQDINKN